MGDIDIDLAPSKLPRIFEEIRKERGELGLVQVCTFGTEGTKSAILTACRGYSTDEYPNGIDVDEAQYLSSLIPQERGFLWPLDDVVYGNADAGRRPVKEFVKELEKYPGLLDIIKGIEGLVCRRGIHASGVILFDEDKIYDTAAIMRAPNGNLTTQWDLHQQESAGSVKYDFLLTSVQDSIIKTIELLQKDKVIEDDLSLREVYNKYLHPSVLPQNDEKMWKALAEGSVIGCFQFEGGIGKQAAKKIKPHSALEMADANGLMRLMPNEETGEMPLDKYVKFKNNIQLWYNEMIRAGLTEQEQKTLEPYFLPSYGVPPSQEQLMKMLMDENICGFTLAEANAARKIVGKKQMSKIPALHSQVLEKAKSKALGKYVWECGIGPQMGYSFSIIHALAYSFVGMQTLYLGTHFNPIYWNTANLIVNSGSLEDISEEEEVNIYTPEDDRIDGVEYKDLPDRSAKVRKTSSTDYAKVAKAIGAIRSAGINVSLADINKSGFGFEPDVLTNQILFGLKGMLNVGDDLVKDIISNRPYSSVDDFLTKVHPSKSSMVSLIKGGAFDKMMDRKECMRYYLDSTINKPKRLTLQNLGALLDLELLPNDTDEMKMANRVYEFNRYLKAACKGDAVNFNIDDRAYNFLIEIDCDTMVEYNSGSILLNKKSWDKIYKSYMEIYRTYIKANESDLIEWINQKNFADEWNKYASGSISAWEMESLCFYYHDHELKDVNFSKYGIVPYSLLPETPRVERVVEKGGHKINIFELSKIAGTVIAKNKYRHTVSLLTTDGVVDIKFRKEHFAYFDKTISSKDENGVKHRLEKSWFDRGTMIVVQGIRTDEGFAAKKYNSSSGHQLYKINKIFSNGDIELQGERVKGDADED